MCGTPPYRISFPPPIFLCGLIARALSLVIKCIDENAKFEIINLPADRLIGPNVRKKLLHLIKSPN